MTRDRRRPPTSRSHRADWQIVHYAGQDPPGNPAPGPGPTGPGPTDPNDPPDPDQSAGWRALAAAVLLLVTTLALARPRDGHHLGERHKTAPPEGQWQYGRPADTDPEPPGRHPRGIRSNLDQEDER